jgi:hypothetical protein
MMFSVGSAPCFYRGRSQGGLPAEMVLSPGIEPGLPEGNEALNLACLPNSTTTARWRRRQGSNLHDLAAYPVSGRGPYQFGSRLLKMVGGEGVEPSWGQAPPGPEPGASTSFASRP